MASLPRILEHISRESLQRMFGDPSAGGYVCSSALRLLDGSSEDEGISEAIAKAYVMRMLFLQSPLPLCTCQGWATEGHLDAHTRALDMLERLGIMDTTGYDGSRAYVLNSSFRDSLVRFLCDPREPWGGGSGRGSEVEALSADAVEERCRLVWEGILRFLVGAGQAEVANTVRNFLVRTELMVSSSDDRAKRLAISAKGYEYLLKDQREQVRHPASCLATSGSAGSLGLGLRK